MPLSYDLQAAQSLIVTTCTGNLTFDEVVGHLRELGERPDLPRRLDVLLDLREVTSVPTVEQLRDVAAAIGRLESKLQWGACAVVAYQGVLFGMSRMFEVFVEGSFTAMHVFEDRHRAEHWLLRQRPAPVP